MEITDELLRIGPGLTATFGILVLFVGRRVNQMVAFLRELSIPEPVTGGLLFSIFFGIVYAATGVAVEFNSPGPVYPGDAKVGGLQSQGGKGEAVVHYCEPLTMQDLEPSGFPARVNNMAKLAQSFLSRRSSKSEVG
jgi:hypothetical protein